MKKRKMNRGFRALFGTLLAVALAAVLLLAAGRVSGRYTRFDMSTRGYYTLSAESEALVKNLEQDVELIFLTVEGGEDLTLQYLLQRYADLSDHITLQTVDVAAESELAAQYAPALRYPNSVAVVSGENTCLVDYAELYENDYSAFYQSGNTADIRSSFRAESALTGAIRYVTAEDLPRLCVLNGHGELSLSDEMSRALREEGIQTAVLDLSVEGAVPADCGVLLIHAPSYDISAAEREKLAAWLEQGGDMILITAYGEPLPELRALMEPYGCTLTEGLVVEQDRDHYIYGYYDCLIPELAEHELTEEIRANNGYVVMPGSQAILSEPQQGVSVTPLLTTSAAAYASTDLGSLGIKAGDIPGPLTVGALIEKGESRVIWYSSGFMLNESYQDSFGGANSALFMESIRSLCNPVPLQIPAKSIGGETLTLSVPQGMAMGAVVTLAIPLVFLIIGAVTVIRRRRKA